MTDWEALRRMMPVPATADTFIDWAGLSQSWGTKFPSDYRRFLESYGFGTIQDFLYVSEPEPKNHWKGQSNAGMDYVTANAYANWPEAEKEPQLVGADPVLIGWGGDGSADILCWDASGDDPDGWPVLMYKSDDWMWRRYDCGMVDFLLGVLRADFDECPLSDTSLWGIASVTLLPPSEELRLLRAGLDPWTGKPDPYAGMYTY